MFKMPTTKLKVFVGLVITVLVLVMLRMLGFIDIHLSTYWGQISNNTSYNGYHRRDIVKEENILRKVPEYMKITSIGNLKTVASPKMSSLFSEIRNKKPQYHIRETIEIFVQLRDSRNKIITKGGDVLRIWIIEESMKASAAGHVIDFNNGSYLGLVKALWVGSPTIKIAIGCTKEHIGMYLNYIEEHGTYIYMIGVFQKEGHPGKNETQCASIPNSKLFKGPACNFTADNYNMPFYCEKPVEYECKDWTIFREEGEHPPLDSKTVSFCRSSVYNIIKEFKVYIKEDLFRFHPSPVKSCSSFPAAETWKRSVPVGYMYENKWLSLQCSIDFPRTTQAYTKCLKKTPLISIGDSTTRLFFVSLMKFLSLKLLPPEEKYKNPNAWHTPMRATSTDGEVSIEWMPHEHPFASGGSRRDLCSVSERLQRIGSNQNVIILIHWYLHPARYLNPELYRQHVKSAVEAIKSLLQRSPNAKIIIKGPHSNTYPTYLIPYDFVAKFMEQVIYEEFKDIHNSVYYVNYWDMTVGNQNEMPHPPDFVNDIMIQNFLSFVCHK